MTKIVVNRCFGGFGLSHEAIMRYAELAGFTLYTRGEGSIVHYSKTNDNELFYKDEYYFYDGEFQRTDPILIRVVEELGEKADGWAASLEVVEVPDGIEWYIDEYDGRETVRETHRSW